MEVPHLETERLILRRHQIGDFDARVTTRADPNVTRYLRDKPFTEEETWTRFLRHFGHSTVLGFGYWAVEERANGRFAGEIGFADYKRDIEPSKGSRRSGGRLPRMRNGKSYATEGCGRLQRGATKSLAR